MTTKSERRFDVCLYKQQINIDRRETELNRTHTNPPQKTKVGRRGGYTKSRFLGLRVEWLRKEQR